jgi:hypothetical protein
MSVRGAAFLGIGAMVGAGRVDTLRNAPQTFVAIVAIAALAVFSISSGSASVGLGKRLTSWSSRRPAASAA